MRIRKRQVPLPFSSIPPVPLSSDPNFDRPPVAVVQLPLRQQQHPPTPHTTPCCFDPPRPSESDLPNHSIGQPLPTQALDSTAFHGTTTHIGEQLMKTKQDYLVLEPGEGGEEEEGKKNDTGKKSVVGEELGTGFLSQSSSSRHQGVGRWGEGEKAFPLKKRRGGAEGECDDTIMAKHAYNKSPVKSNAGKMKTKPNKKLVQQGTNNEQQVMNESSGVDVDYPIPSGAKKRGRGGALMEGSRCSRVNGRGWRCCQQTLIGYSLCEHHLGKGRLRSITSVRSRAKEVREANNAADKQALVLSNSSSSSQQLGKQTKGESGEDGKPLMIAQKRVKLGMVKARSISSLLGQDDNAIAVADDNN